MWEILQTPQLERALLIAVIAGPVMALLGTFITLRGMAFFSDAISHAALTGVGLGVALRLTNDVYGTGMQFVLIVFCCLVGLMMAWLFERTSLRADTVIAFSYSGAVALGVILISQLKGYQSLEGVLFGEILFASETDVWTILGLSVLVLVFLLLNLRALLLCVVQEDLARIAGVNIRRLNYLFVLLIALVIALLLQQLGALLISGLIVIPAAASRMISSSFRQMLVMAAVFGVFAGVIGITASAQFDLPTGPTIVLANVALLVAAMVLGAILGRARSDRANTNPLDQV
ncbi:MAG TPA: metal ABC transporter permease [Chthoniobacterales bacterium]|jgi:zinc transport system permease protein